MQRRPRKEVEGGESGTGKRKQPPLLPQISEAEARAWILANPEKALEILGVSAEELIVMRRYLKQAIGKASTVMRMIEEFQR